MKYRKLTANSVNNFELNFGINSLIFKPFSSTNKFGLPYGFNFVNFNSCILHFFGNFRFHILFLFDIRRL